MVSYQMWEFIQSSWIKFLYRSVSMKPCKVFTSISPYLIREWWQNISSFWQLSLETVTRSKYVAKYEHAWKWMVEFLSKFRGHGIKIDRINSSRVAKSIIFSASNVPLLAKWRHHELSFSLRWIASTFP